VVGGGGGQCWCRYQCRHAPVSPPGHRLQLTPNFFHFFQGPSINELLDDCSAAKSRLNSVKEQLHDLITRDCPVSEIPELNPNGSHSIQLALEEIGNPFQALMRLAIEMRELVKSLESCDAEDYLTLYVFFSSLLFSSLLFFLFSLFFSLFSGSLSGPTVHHNASVCCPHNSISFNIACAPRSTTVSSLPPSTRALLPRAPPTCLRIRNMLFYRALRSRSRGSDTCPSTALLRPRSRGSDTSSSIALLRPRACGSETCSSIALLRPRACGYDNEPCMQCANLGMR
jgi:hypothetical protein